MADPLELKRLKAAGAPVVFDRAAGQVLRMVRARLLADDPVLLGRQRELAASKVVGSGVDASATGAGKTVTNGRAIAHRAATPPRRPPAPPPGPADRAPRRDHPAPTRAGRGRGPPARPVARRAHAGRPRP